MKPLLGGHKLITLRDGLGNLDESGRQMVMRDSVYGWLRPDEDTLDAIPSELYPLTLGDIVGLGMHDYPETYNIAELDQSVSDTFGKWAWSMGGCGVRIPNTPYKLQTHMGNIIYVRLAHDSEPVLPDDWRSYVTVSQGSFSDFIWRGNNVRTAHYLYAPAPSIDPNKYVKEEWGWRLRFGDM